MLLETLMSDPDSVQKAFPQQSEGFLVFFGARRLGVRLTMSSSRSGTLVTHVSAYSCGAGRAELIVWYGCRPLPLTPQAD
jgi:hypothetical protein